MQQQITSLTEMMGLILKQQNYTLNYTHQNPLNKGVSDDMGLIDNNKNYTHNYTSDTDTESDKEKDNINKNIIYKPEEIIKEKENNFINKISKEKESEPVKDIDISNEIEQNEVKMDYTNNEEKNSDISNEVFQEEPVEKTIKKIFNVENAVKVADTPIEQKIITPTKEMRSEPTHYNFFPVAVQQEKFDAMIEKLKQVSSIEELDHKHALMQKYMREHTFGIWYLTDAQKIYKELKEKLDASTESDFSTPSSPSNSLDGIVITSMDFNATGAIISSPEEEEIETVQMEVSEEDKLSPSSPSIDDNEVVDHQEDNNATGAKEMAFEDIAARVQRIRDERMAGLRKIVDDAITEDEIKEAAKKVNSYNTSLSTDEMAELMEILHGKISFSLYANSR